MSKLYIVTVATEQKFYFPYFLHIDKNYVNFTSSYYQLNGVDSCTVVAKRLEILIS